MPPAGAPVLEALPTTAQPAIPPVARGVARLSPYEPTTSLDHIQAHPGQTPYKLDWNEATIPPSPRVMEGIARFLGNSHHLNWYPELYSRRLMESLASYTGLGPEHLLVTNGSDDALALICNTFIDPADEIVVPTPTYTHFLVFAQAKGGRVVSVRYDDPFELQLDRILGAITPRTKVIYLVSPNNPTGVTFSREEVERVLDHAPHAIVIVDEAYHEFYGQTVLPLARTRPNLVVTRTFSKSFGMAGLRIGYLAALPELVHELKRLFNPKSVNVLGQIAARAALDDLDYLDRYVGEVSASKPLFVEYFRSRGIPVRSTPANYILFQPPDARVFCERLADAGVYVRDRSAMQQLEGYVRMSIGTVAQTREVIRIIDRIIDRVLSE
jgi:histidinol-phosphate aminotransferase